MKKLFILFSLFFSSFLVASYLSVNWGEDVLLQTVTGDKTFFAQYENNFSKHYLNISASMQYAGLNERINSFDNTASFYNHFSSLSFHSFEILFFPISLLQISAGITPIKTFSYQSTYEYPLETITKEGAKIYHSKGTLNDVHFNVLTRLGSMIFLGGQFHFLTGKQEILNQWNNYFDTASSFTNSTSYSYQGIDGSTELGIHITPMTILLGVKFPYTLKKKSDDKTDTLAYPLETGIRAELVFSQKLPLTFYLEADYKWYQSFLYNENPIPEFRNILSFLTGVNYRLKLKKDKGWLRLGYIFEPYPNNPYADKSTMFAGFDYQWQTHFILHLDYELSIRNYVGDNLFYEDNQFIQEKTFALNMGMSFFILR